MEKGHGKEGTYEKICCGQNIKNLRQEVFKVKIIRIPTKIPMMTMSETKNSLTDKPNQILETPMHSVAVTKMIDHQIFILMQKKKSIAVPEHSIATQIFVVDCNCRLW